MVSNKISKEFLTTKLSIENYIGDTLPCLNHLFIGDEKAEFKRTLLLHIFKSIVNYYALPDDMREDAKRRGYYNEECEEVMMKQLYESTLRFLHHDQDADDINLAGDIFTPEDIEIVKDQILYRFSL